MVSVLTIMGVLVVIGSGISYFTIPKSIEYVLPMVINLGESGMVYPMYMNPPFAMKSRYYLFDLKNRRDFLNGAKPKFGVKGPFVFTTRMMRSNISWHNNGQSVSFDSRRSLVTDEEMSQNLDEKFWIFNPIVLGLADQVRVMVLDRVPLKRLVEPIVFNSVNVFLDQFKESAIVRRSGRDFLEGFKIEFLDFITKLASQFGLSAMIPPGPPNNIFGIAYTQNETTDNMEIWAGVGQSRQRYAEMVAWHGQTILKYWRGRCNRLDGTNGELYKPFVKVGKPIRIFLGAICRSLWLDPMGPPRKLDNGLWAAPYEFSMRTYMSVKNNPANDCYCKNQQDYDCKYDGLMSMGPCFFDAPLYFSRPNMTGADKRIRGLYQSEVVNGTVLPDKQEFWLEPITGTPLIVNMTFMAVFKVSRQPYMRDLDKVQPLTFAPVFAASEALGMSDDIVMQFKMLQMLYYEHRSICMIGFMIGSIMILLGMFISCCCSCMSCCSSKSSAKVGVNANKQEAGKSMDKPTIAAPEMFDDPMPIRTRSGVSRQVRSSGRLNVQDYNNFNNQDNFGDEDEEDFDLDDEEFDRRRSMRSMRSARSTRSSRSSRNHATHGLYVDEADSGITRSVRSAASSSRLPTNVPDVQRHTREHVDDNISTISSSIRSSGSELLGPSSNSQYERDQQQQQQRSRTSRSGRAKKRYNNSNRDQDDEIVD